VADPDKKTIGERINTWVQTVGIVAAGIWASYTFVYNEVFVPRSAKIREVAHHRPRRRHKNRNRYSPGTTTNNQGTIYATAVIA